MHRIKLGAATLALSVAGIAVLYFGEQWGWVLIRAGAFFAVLWLAFPQLQHVPQTVWIGILMLGGVIAFLGRRALYVLPIVLVLLILMTILRPRPPRR